MEIFCLETPKGSRRRQIQYYIDDNGCHICISHARNRDGYPVLWANGHGNNMHRVLYEEKYGKLYDLLARHKCDVPACINLDHIEPGSSADNTKDITLRNRHNPPYGERAGNTHLTKEDIIAIRASEGISQYKLASQYGVNQSEISRIKSGKRWSFLS